METSGSTDCDSQGMDPEVSTGVVHSLIPYESHQSSLSAPIDLTGSPRQNSRVTTSAPAQLGS